MNSLIPKFIENPDLYVGNSATLRAIGEFKGRQDIYLKLETEALETLRNLALIESTESSNRLEGIVTTHKRIIDIVLRSSAPRNRSEQKIAGYRDALAYIHENWKAMEMNIHSIKLLHSMIYKFLTVEGGNWKQTENVIMEKYADGTMRVRFQPVSVEKTPSAMEVLILGYQDAINSGGEPLVIIPLTILDFLCIHPFSDGNGRMARLLTLLLLYKAGYHVGKYISLERIFESSKQSYYETLEASSIDWHESEQDIVPWTTYFWGVIIAAYKEFESRAGSIKKFYGSKTELIHQAIERKFAPFSISEIEDECPGISRVMIKTVLRQMRDSGEIRSTGVGRSAKWVKVETVEKTEEKAVEKDFSDGWYEKWYEMGLTEREIQIIMEIKKNPKISISIISKILGIYPSAVQKQLNKLKYKGILERIGPAKGGHWEIIESTGDMEM